MKDNEMETIFCVYDPDIKTKFYLLYDWRAAEDRKVLKWFQTLTPMGFENGKVNCLPICNFDCNNLAWN